MQSDRSMGLLEMTDNSPVAVAIVSKNPLAREGLRRVIEGEVLTVVETHASSRGLTNTQKRSNPSIVILDHGKDQKNLAEIEACQSAAPDAKIVILSDKFDFDMMLEAFDAGVHAYIVKRIGCEALIGSLKLVHLGEKVMPSELASGFSARLSSGQELSFLPEAERMALLSDREIETLRHLIVGLPNKVIAARLDITEATVKVHVKAILRKLNVQNRTQAAIWAVNNGIEVNQSDASAAKETESSQSESAAETEAAQ